MNRDKLGWSDGLLLAGAVGLITGASLAVGFGLGLVVFGAVCVGLWQMLDG